MPLAGNVTGSGHGLLKHAVVWRRTGHASQSQQYNLHRFPGPYGLGFEVDIGL